MAARLEAESRHGPREVCGPAQPLCSGPSPRPPRPSPPQASFLLMCIMGMGRPGPAPALPSRGLIESGLGSGGLGRGGHSLPLLQQRELLAGRPPQPQGAPHPLQRTGRIESEPKGRVDNLGGLTTPMDSQLLPFVFHSRTTPLPCPHVMCCILCGTCSTGR